MSPQRSIGQQIISADLRIQKLLEDAALVGGIYTI